MKEGNNSLFTPAPPGWEQGGGWGRTVRDQPTKKWAPRTQTGEETPGRRWFEVVYSPPHPARLGHGLMSFERPVRVLSLGRGPEGLFSYRGFAKGCCSLGGDGRGGRG